MLLLEISMNFQNIILKLQEFQIKDVIHKPYDLEKGAELFIQAPFYSLGTTPWSGAYVEPVEDQIDEDMEKIQIGFNITINFVNKPSVDNIQDYYLESLSSFLELIPKTMIEDLLRMIGNFTLGSGVWVGKSGLMAWKLHNSYIFNTKPGALI